MRLEVNGEVNDDTVRAVSDLVQAADEFDAHPPLRQPLWFEPEGEGTSLGVVAWDGDRLLGLAHARRGDERWWMEIVIHPRHRHALEPLVKELVVAAASAVAQRGGGEVGLWVNRRRPDHDAVASVCDLVPARALYQMRRPLPLGLPRELDTRPFRPGADDEALLAVNNRAFAWHPDQGGWTTATLAERQRQPWFDADGLLFHERDGRLLGFCWTKIHRDRVPPLGEIYVIGVDPDATGKGIGRGLTVAGLDHMANHGVPLGVLYVEATNDPALRLYRDLGFAVDHVDQLYTGRIDPAGT